MHDPLHRRAAVGAGLTVAAVDGELGPEGGHPLGEAAGALRAEAIRPLPQHGARRLVEPRDLLRGEPLRELHRGEARAVEDLVGVGIPDAREEVRIGERALQGVVLARQGVGERVGARFQRLDPASRQRGELLQAQHVERGAALRPGLGEREGAPRELERRQHRAGAAALRPRRIQCSRPAIMRWSASARPPSRTSTTRLPSRRTSTTLRPSASRSGGSTVRSRNGVVTRAATSGSPTTRSARAST